MLNLDYGLAITGCLAAEEPQKVPIVPSLISHGSAAAALSHSHLLKRRDVRSEQNYKGVFFSKASPMIILERL